MDVDMTDSSRHHFQLETFCLQHICSCPLELQLLITVNDPLWIFWVSGILFGWLLRPSVLLHMMENHYTGTLGFCLVYAVSSLSFLSKIYPSALSRPRLLLAFL